MKIEYFIGIYLLLVLIRIFISISSGFLYVRPQKKHKYFSIINNSLVSVIVPAWNEQVGILKTLESVKNSIYPNIELVVVDDGSSDETFKIINNFRAENPKMKTIAISQPNSGKANALNNGIRNANGEVIITLDADSFLEPKAISALMSTFKNDDYDVAIGQIIVGDSKSFIGDIQFFEYIFGFHLKKSQHVLNSIFIFPGALTAIRKSVFDNVGYFEDYSSTEDFDFSLKVRQHGLKAVYVEDAICVTEGASTINGLINQRTRWRHGFLDCIVHHDSFLTNTKKGFYLTFFEFPLALWGIVDLIFYPIFLFFIVHQSIISVDKSIVLLSFLLLPAIFIFLAWDRIKINDRRLKYIIFLPLILTFINVIEFIAFFKAFWRLLNNEKTIWTSWNRKGIES